MSTDRLTLHDPPSDARGFELWIQHAAGRIIFEDVRGFALQRIDKSLSERERAAAIKGINDAVYGLMMVIDGVSGAIRNDMKSVELSMKVRLVDRGSLSVIAENDLQNGDGMCMSYHSWLEGDFGSDPVVISEENGDA